MKIPQVIHLLLLACNAFISNKIIGRPDFRVDIVAWKQYELKSLIAYLIILNAPYARLIFLLIPVEAVKMSGRTCFENFKKTF